MCSVKDCDNSNFDNEDRCSLHCKKSEKNGWYKIDEKQEKVWDEPKLELFWEQIQNTIHDIDRINSDMENLNNPILSKIKYNYNFIKVIFPEGKHINKGYFFDLNESIDIGFNKCIFLGSTNFSLISKSNNIIFNHCVFFENIEFRNMDFKGLFLFQKCRVCKDIEFRNIIFADTSSFIKSKFYKNLYFIHSRFDNLALFNEIKAEELNFDNTFFKEEANFLDMTVNVANRETARIIKNAFEGQNNIIEANKYYTKEMQEREKELKILESPLEWLVFKVHGITSNHSQDWFLVLLWIVNITIVYSFFKSFDRDVFIGTLLLGTLSFCIMFYMCKDIGVDKYKNLIISSLVFILLLINCKVLNNIKCNDAVTNFNPYSIMTVNDPLTFGLLIYKIVITYLIYQFIISIRQNTRRK